MRYLASQVSCIKSDDSPRDSESYFERSERKGSGQNRVKYKVNFQSEYLGARISKSLKNNKVRPDGKDIGVIRKSKLSFPKLNNERLEQDSDSQNVNTSSVGSASETTAAQRSFQGTFVHLKDNSSCETIYLTPDELSRSSNYESNTLSNTSLGSHVCVENNDDAYAEGYVSVQEHVNDSESNEIVLDLHDNSGTLCKTINLETLSRIDSVCAGENSVKFRYRLPRMPKVIPGMHADAFSKLGKHTKYKDSRGEEKVRSVYKAHADAVFRLIARQIKKSFVRLYGVITLYYSILITAIYLLVCENPLWEGIAAKAWRLLYEKERFSYGFLIWVFIALINIVPPMFVFFEEDSDDTTERSTLDIALVIPAHKAAGILPKTLSAAVEVFPPENIFVIANGNSVYPIDNTEDICAEFNVNHCWVPYGCKLGALYVGVCRVANYKYVLTIDDDCLLPSNFPLPVERFKDGVACIGYTITSCGPNFTKGNIIHKLQDIEYKLSGLTKHFQGKFGGSTMFPHGAVSMWDREIIYRLFDRHPGYHIGEDWFFGHVARRLGYRIELCSKVFVKTETPRSMFIAPNTTRGGFGELTVAKQRIFRWNYFLLKCLMDNLYFILFCWKMPKWYHNVLSKIWVTLEVVQTLQYILLPLIIPVFYKNAYFTLSVTSALMAFSLFIVIMFNLLHLGRKNDARVDWIPVLVFVPYIILCYATNFLSHIWAILHYGIYYSKKRLRITKIPEVMSIVSGGIDNITKTFHRTMVHAEQKSIHGVVHTPDTDSIMQSPRALPRQNEFISCISSTRPLRGPHEMNSFHYPSPQHRNYKLKPKSKTYVRRPGNVYTKSGPFSNTVIIRPGQEIRIMDI